MDKRSNPESVSWWKDYANIFKCSKLSHKRVTAKEENILEKWMSYVTVLVLMIGVKFVFFNIHLNLKLAVGLKVNLFNCIISETLLLNGVKLHDFVNQPPKEFYSQCFQLKWNRKSSPCYKQREGKLLSQYVRSEQLLRRLI